MFKDGIFVLNDCKIHYITIDSPIPKPTLFLFHGLNPAFNSWKVWEKNLQILSTMFKVYAFDLCGYNKTLIPQTSSFEFSDAKLQAKIILDIIEKEAFKTLSLCGISWGCSVINEIIRVVPEKVRLTIFVSPAVTTKNLSNALTEGKIPTVIVCSPQDPVISYSQIKELAIAIPHTIFLEIPVHEHVEPLSKIHHIQSLKADEVNEDLMKAIHQLAITY